MGIPDANNEYDCDGSDGFEVEKRISPLRFASVELTILGWLKAAENYS
jgi:hypothetical protein